MSFILLSINFIQFRELLFFSISKNIFQLIEDIKIELFS